MHVPTKLTVTELAVPDPDDLILCFLVHDDCSRSEAEEQSLDDRSIDEGLPDESEKGRDFTN